MVAEPDLDNLIQLIGVQTCHIFHADIAYLALLDPLTNLIHFPYQYGEEFTKLNFGDGLTSKIIIDATRQLPGEGGPEKWPEVSREIIENMSPETFDLVARRWADYWKGWRN